MRHHTWIIMMVLFCWSASVLSVAADEWPLHFDWRDVEGRNYLTAVKDKGECATGTVFAYVAMMEAMIKIAVDNDFIEPDLSEYQALLCSGGHCLRPSSPDEVIAELFAEGVADEACLVYDDEAATCDYRCRDFSARAIKPVAQSLLSYPSPIYLMDALLDGPIVVRKLLYGDYLTYTGGVYRHESGALLGVHDVLIVGYDAEEQYWICKDARGTQWGENGYVNVAWDQALFGEQLTQLFVDADAMCAANEPPTIDDLEATTDSEGVIVYFSYADAQANLAGGELWYAVDDLPAERYARPVTELKGVVSVTTAHQILIPLDLSAGEHSLTVFVRDWCGAESNHLQIPLTVAADQPVADDYNDDAGDDDATKQNDDSSTDSEQADDDDAETGCGR